jgi:hypothetical protein
MSFETKTRYGARVVHTDFANAAKAVEDLIQELETEEFEKPDNEHTQVAVAYGGWAVTAQVSGLLTLSDLRGITGSPNDRPNPELYIRATSREQVKSMLLALAEGRLSDVRNVSWNPLSQVPPYKEDLFKRSSDE